MNEYRVEIKVKNNLIFKRIQNAGYKTVGEFCSKFNLNQSALGEIINLKETPLRKDGTFSTVILKTAELLDCMPEDLFTTTQLYTALKSNKKIMEVEEYQMQALVSSLEEKQIALEDMVAKDQLSDRLYESMDKLSPREKMVLTKRHGLNGEATHFYSEIAKELGVTIERARQIEKRAIRRLTATLNANNEKFIDNLKVA